ncbi:hypothetical protein ACWGBV_32075, partial [Streptomyces sp. NPDC055051]
AADARDVATRAEADADAAETSASNAHNLAKEADEAATRAEEEERKRLEEERKRHVDAGSLYSGGPLSGTDEELLRQLCGQQCVDEYKAARDLASGDVEAWVRANGGAILIELFGLDNIKECLSTWDFEACVWALIDVAGYLVPVTKIPAVAKALIAIGKAVDKFFESSKLAKQLLDKYNYLLKKARNAPSCLVPQPKQGSSGTASHSAWSFETAAFSSSGGTSSSSDYGWPDDWDDGASTPAPNYGWPEDYVPPSQQPEDKGKWKIADLCRKPLFTGHFLKGIRDVHFDGGPRVDGGKGIWKANTSDAMLEKIFDLAEEKCTNWTQGSQTRYRVCVFNPGLGTVGRKNHDGDTPTSLVELVVSLDGDAITMYPK